MEKITFLSTCIEHESSRPTSLFSFYLHDCLSDIAVFTACRFASHGNGSLLPLSRSSLRQLSPRSLSLLPVRECLQILRHQPLETSFSISLSGSWRKTGHRSEAPSIASTYVGNRSRRRLSRKAATWTSADHRINLCNHVPVALVSS